MQSAERGARTSGARTRNGSDGGEIRAALGGGGFRQRLDCGLKNFWLGQKTDDEVSGFFKVVEVTRLGQNAEISQQPQCGFFFVHYRNDGVPSSFHSQATAQAREIATNAIEDLMLYRFL